MLADSTVVGSGTPPFFVPPTSATAGSAAAAAAATRALIMNPAAYLAAGAAAAPFLYGNNALRYRPKNLNTFAKFFALTEFWICVSVTRLTKNFVFFQLRS